MPMKHDIDVIRDFVRRNVLQTEFQSAPHKIDNQRPIVVGVTVSPNDGDLPPDGAELVEDRLGANVAEVPDLVRAPGQVDDVLRQLVVRVGENKDFQSAKHQTPGTKEVSSTNIQSPERTSADCSVQNIQFPWCLGFGIW